MDVLNDILESMHLGGGVHFRCEFSAPWGIAMKASPSADFHVIVRGNCWLRIPGRTQPIALQGGDLVAFIHGGPHRLSDGPEHEATPVEEILQGSDMAHYGPLVHGGDGLPATILCGHFELDRESPHPLIATLPGFMHLRGIDCAEFVWLQSVLNFMTYETEGARPGAETIVNRLAGVLFVQLVRAYAAQATTHSTMLAAIVDKQLGPILELMHGEPQREWTLESLARQAGISRSALAARFPRFVGMTPMQYLTMWRMQMARSNLRETKLDMAAIAARSGYRSEIAFSKAFKRTVGKAPGAFRRDCRGT